MVAKLLGQSRKKIKTRLSGKHVGDKTEKLWACGGTLLLL